MIKLRIHSSVDVITNSSTVIYTYQNSTEEAKALIDEVLRLAGIDEKAEDLFDFEEMSDGYDDNLYCEMDVTLKIRPRSADVDKKYTNLIDKIYSLLGSVTGDGGMDG
jgi:hypothetical protein